MRQVPVIILVILCSVMMSCVHAPNKAPAWTTTLEQDFQSAQPIMYEFDRDKMEFLRKRLHQRLIDVGDEKFARTLAQQTNEVQTEVCNVMGLLEEKPFDKFPKTRYALSAAPKI
jgi:hypothetical protein